MFKWRRLIALSAVAASGCAAETSQVEPLQIALGAAEGQLSHEFTKILSARELPDGRVLVTDARENRIFLAHFDADSVSQLSAVGDGPHEYREAGRLFAVSNDSTIMIDRRARRWLTFVGGEVGGVVSPDHPAVEASSRGSVLGMDRVGYLIARVPSPGSSGMSDSLHLVRIRRSSGEAEVIGRSASPAESGVVIESAAASGGVVPQRPTYAMSIITFDQAAVFPDGWVGIARNDPYRIDWCAAPNPCRVGGSLIERAPPYTPDNKAAYLAMARATSSWPPTQDPEETAGWPETVPAFALPASVVDGTAVFPSPDGRILVRRVPVADAPANRYDVVGRTGKLEASIQLPANHEVVEFGDEYVYVAVTDELGVQRLQRHRWP